MTVHFACVAKGLQLGATSLQTPASMIFLATAEMHENVGFLLAWLIVNVHESWLVLHLCQHCKYGMANVGCLPCSLNSFSNPSRFISC